AKWLPHHSYGRGVHRLHCRSGLAMAAPRGDRQRRRLPKRNPVLLASCGGAPVPGSSTDTPCPSTTVRRLLCLADAVDWPVAGEERHRVRLRPATNRDRLTIVA